MISLVWSAAARAVAVKCPRLQPFWASEVNANAISHRESIVQSHTMTDLQNEMHQTNPAFVTWAKMNDLRNPFIKRPHLTLAKPRRIYSRPVCGLKLDRGESVHLRCSVAIDRTVGESLSRWRVWTRLKSKHKNIHVYPGLWGQEVLFVCYMNGSEFSDIMMSLPLGNGNYTRPFPVSHQPPLLCRLWVKMPLNFAYVRRKNALHRLSCGPRNRGGKDVRKQRIGSQECRLSYYNRLVKTWRAEKLLPTELENNTMAAPSPLLTQQLCLPEEC